jgi:beta-lactam-binding protein with PASTA domain
MKHEFWKDTAMRNKSLVILILGLSVALSAGCRKRVPDLQGKTEAEAGAALKEVDLELGDVQPAKGAPGVVADQEPKAGERLPKDKRVSIVLGPAPAGETKDTKGTSTTPGIVVVPRLTDQTVDQAKKALEAVQLALGEQTVIQNPGTSGTIFGQDPAEGLKVEAGTAVNVKVRATALVEVPEVVGKVQAVAEQMLKDARLTVGQIENRVAESGPPQGSVLDSNPSPHTRILEQTPVKLVIRQEAVSVPPVTNKLLDGAKVALFERGLVPVASCRQTDNKAQWGIVFNQDPLENRVVAKGTQVVISYSAGLCRSRFFEVFTPGGKMILDSKIGRRGGGGQ